MDLFLSVMIVAFYFLVPALIIYLCYTFPAINKIGPVILCYIAGITIGNIGVLPKGAKAIGERRHVRDDRAHSAALHGASEYHEDDGRDVRAKGRDA